VVCGYRTTVSVSYPISGSYDTKVVARELVPLAVVRAASERRRLAAVPEDLRDDLAVDSNRELSAENGGVEREGDARVALSAAPARMAAADTQIVAQSAQMR